MLSKKYIPLYLIILLACLYLILKNNIPLKDKQYDKEYKIPSNYGSEEASPIYSLPRQWKKLLADLEKTIETSGSGTFGRVYATWNNLCGFYIDNKEKFKLSVKHDFISSVDLYNLPLNQFPDRCDINGATIMKRHGIVVLNL